MTSIYNNSVEKVLYKLYEDAKNDFSHFGQRVTEATMRSMKPADFENAYLPISKQQGQYLREIIVKNDCKQVVEFGTSFGISTIYLADAVRQTGGRVITTEIIESKANKAIQNISDANLNTYVEVKIGNAMKTLKKYNSPIDFLFLDGWKDLYLPLFKMLEPLFYSGTIICADNVNMEDTKPYAEYVLTNKSKYTTHSFENGAAFHTVVS